MPRLPPSSPLGTGEPGEKSLEAWTRTNKWTQVSFVVVWVPLSWKVDRVVRFLLMCPCARGISVLIYSWTSEALKVRTLTWSWSQGRWRPIFGWVYPYPYAVFSELDHQVELWLVNLIYSQLNYCRNWVKKETACSLFWFLFSFSACFCFLNRYWVGCVGATHDTNLYDVIKTWADSIDQKLSKYGIFPQGPEADKVHERLKQLKLKYDPENVFHQNININPKAE